MRPAAVLRSQVYPRVCGGTSHRPTFLHQLAGLSPRVRGNRQLVSIGIGKGGSIPACAGEPPFTPQQEAPYRVYPRVCGGTSRVKAKARLSQGLSPRVRGNRAAGSQPATAARSIPACAGEPPPTLPTASPRRVYPRVCGGTAQRTALQIPSDGLSPRVRGNRDELHHRRVPGGSIPACAGEPGNQPHPAGGSGVYPRVCGGTCAAPPPAQGLKGLSPRVRGNQAYLNEPARKLRSIPACAGEPDPGPHAGSGPGVYPRVCGGTGPPSPPAVPKRGLSPRVRGNHAGQANYSASKRSIPACAGEPPADAGGCPGRRVYPRVCGGTPSGSASLATMKGLSPRVRGNPPCPGLPSRPARSIPACAGEPRNGKH